MMRKPPIITALLILLVGLPRTTMADDTKPTVDGIYFLPANHGSVRLFRIRKNRFDIRLIGNLGGTVTGYFHGGASGLHLIYFNGAKQVRCECTCAVIDGRLWVGVFQRDVHNKDQFNCRTIETGVFGPAQAGMPAGTIRWNEAKATWFLTPPQGNINESIVIENVRVIRHPDNKKDRRLMPVFSEADHKTMATLFRDNGPAHSRGRAGRSAWAAGLFVPEGWRFEDVLKKGKTDGVERTRVIDRTLRVSGGRRTFEQYGDVILAPWSVDLGPIGMVPAKVKAENLMGEYVAIQNDKLRVTMLKPKPKAENDVPLALKHFPFGPPTEAQRRKLLSTLKPDADDWGLRRRVFQEHCGMGHVDWPGYDLWLPLSDNRLARYIVPSTHMMSGKIWPVNRVVVMKKVEQ